MGFSKNKTMRLNDLKIDKSWKKTN